MIKDENETVTFCKAPRICFQLGSKDKCMSKVECRYGKKIPVQKIKKADVLHKEAILPDPDKNKKILTAYAMLGNSFLNSGRDDMPYGGAE